jgi:hypothetical protein
MDTDLYFEAELIDASTNKPVIKVVRKGEGKTLANENTPLTVETMKQVIDDMAVDAVKFDPLSVNRQRRLTTALFIFRLSGQPSAQQQLFRFGKHHQITQQDQRQSDHGVAVPDIPFIDGGNGQGDQRKQQRTVGGFAGADAPHQSEIGAEGDHRAEQRQVKQGAKIADGPLRHEIIAAEQSDSPHHQRAVQHRPAVGGQRFQPRRWWRILNILPSEKP